MAAARAMAKKIRKGDTRAEVADRIEGKVPKVVDREEGGKSPVRVIVLDVPWPQNRLHDSHSESPSQGEDIVRQRDAST